MTSKAHWDSAYDQRGSTNVSWFRPHLEISLNLIRRAAPSPHASIIDVGGGASTLVDDLLAVQYRDVSVLDISAAALAVAQSRLGPAASAVTWIDGDITRIDLPAARYDVWHDRAVFHFLTSPTDRELYVELVKWAVKPGGHVIMATFAADGPEKCSGLPVARYDAASLHGQFGGQFELLDSRRQTHLTPAGKEQHFTYCFCRMIGNPA
ncbi:MAG: class I SAM-dependent methyltransferase [Planctomycetes bacterium]|nr:class I SAM-dependent methyltransferase [Planctomycetota bacterium]